MDCFSASVTSDGSIPQVAFATQEISVALKEVGRDDLQVTLSIQPDKDSPEAFEIKTDGTTPIQIIGSDANGAMYGGIEVYFFQMNVWAHNAIGKYGITQDQANPALIKYVRACTKELLLTYPNIKGIGVTSGENDRRELDNTPLSTEYYCYNTFAKGIMDAQTDPRYVDREFRFIIRRHGSESETIAEALKSSSAVFS